MILPPSLRSVRIDSAIRRPNEPSFVSPNFTSSATAVSVMSKSIHRLSASAPKRSVRSSASTLPPSGPTHSFLVTSVPVLPPSALTSSLCSMRPCDLGRLGPEIDAVHVAVREPERPLVGMVGFLVGIPLAHRPGPRHLLARRADDRPEDRLDLRLKDVGRKRLVADLARSRRRRFSRRRCRRRRRSRKSPRMATIARARRRMGRFLERGREDVPGCDRTRSGIALPPS